MTTEVVNLTPELLAEVDDPKRFAAPEWTQRLARMPRTELDKLIGTKRYKRCVERVGKLGRWLEETFVGKKELIELMLVSTTAQLPMLMLGTWGTGKSMLVRKLAAGMGISPWSVPIDHEDGELKKMLDGDVPSDGPDGRHFEYLVTRFTTPEEILGAANVDLMLRKSVYMRQTGGLLPRAEIAFLDEVFKANSSILNALLAILNERIFHNAGRTWRVNLIMLFAASNEPPREEESEELGAFYDRFPVRALCGPVASDQLNDLLSKSHRNAVTAELSGNPDNRPADLPCVNDFRLLHKISLVKFGGEKLADDTKSSQLFLDRFRKLFEHLRTPYDLSDRSFGQYYRLARARALLAGREHLEPEDCKVLYYCGKNPHATSELRAWVDRFLSSG